MTQKIYTLNQESPAIQYLCAKDKHLAKVIEMVGPLTYTLNPNGYGFLVSQIMGQMVSNKVADVFLQRLQDQCGGHLLVDRINALTDEQLRSVGISRSKVQYIRNLTTAIESGKVQLSAFAALSDSEILTQLTAIKGIGNWSAKMYLIFVMNRPNVLPFEDLAFLQGYGWMLNTTDYRKVSVVKKCRKWSPYASIAARYMYEALDGGYTRAKFHLFK